LEAFLVSLWAVALGEMGDKTQLLAFVLAAKFRRPVPIILGVLTATLVNHFFAGLLGQWVAGLLGPTLLRWVVGILFLAMAAWVLVPDKADAQVSGLGARFGIYGTTVVTFFLAEMGDKTQIATAALAAHYHDLPAVVAGTTAGMMLSDVPAIFLGGQFAQKIPMRLVHAVAALLFAVLGLLALFNIGHAFNG
jgi:putative Ca2+/H+ antiporter (TMEM165/GDT1 family)